MLTELRQFRLWQPEYSETEELGRDVWGNDPSDAVERWAELDDARSADYVIVGGTPATVMLRDLDSGHITEWIVSGKTVAIYSARQK